MSSRLALPLLGLLLVLGQAGAQKAPVDLGPCTKQPSKGECGPQCQEETRAALSYIKGLLHSSSDVSRLLQGELPAWR